MASVTTKKSETVYELTLSEAEAETLRAVCDNVAGSPTESRRKHTDAINRALRLAGVDSSGRPAHGCIGFDNCDC